MSFRQITEVLKAKYYQAESENSWYVVRKAGRQDDNPDIPS